MSIAPIMKQGPIHGYMTEQDQPRGEVSGSEQSTVRAPTAEKGKRPRVEMDVGGSRVPAQLFNKAVSSSLPESVSTKKQKMEVNEGPKESMQSPARPMHSVTIQNRREAPYLKFIREGSKTAECRVNYPEFRKIKVGDTIRFYNHYEGVLCRVTWVHVYKTFREMVIGEKVQNILPHICDPKVDSEALINRAVKVYENFPGSHNVRKFGAVAIGVIYLHECFKR